MNCILEKLAFWLLKFYLFWLNWIEWKSRANGRADPACLFHSWLTACKNYEMQSIWYPSIPTSVHQKLVSSTYL